MTSVSPPRTGTTTASAYRWVVLFMAWTAFTMTSIDRSAWGPASASVSESLDVPLAALGLFATGYYLGYVLSNAGCGVLVDRLGSRLVLGVSGLGAGLAMVLFGSADSIPLGLFLQALVGFFAGVDFAAGLKLIATWFAPDRRGLATGVFMNATSLGTVVANAVVPVLLAAADWRVSYHLFGAATMAIALACLLLVRNGAQAAERTRGELPDIRSVLRNRDLLLLGCAGFGGLWGTYGFVTWSNTLMTAGSGIDPVRAGNVLIIFAGIAIAAKLAVGWVCDLFGLGPRTPIAVLLAFFGAALLVFGTLDTYAQFLWFAPLLGIGAYAYSPLIAAMAPLLSGTAAAGSAAGAINAFWQLGAVLVPAVIGPVFAATGSFLAAFATLAAGPLAGAGLILVVRERGAGAAAGG
ncbi:nitrate/nitrite transporter [Nocardiopsis mangrovi]|uniref:Nitrate/nitrite transporter n=1 Tax=Nocardiopsis mangrovi TaxID=1179818 RepID=A0ABV9E3N3_9ACTN